MVFPQMNLVGSVPTPYIYDDRASIKDIAEQMMVAYKMGRAERKRRGKLGREWVISDESMMSAKHMSENFMKYMGTAIEQFKPRKRFEIMNTDEFSEEIAGPKGIYNPITKTWD